MHLTMSQVDENNKSNITEPALEWKSFLELARLLQKFVMKIRSPIY